MTSKDEMDDRELLAEFQRLAIEHDRASMAGDQDAANQCVSDIGRVVRRLWQKNGESRQALSGIADLASCGDGRIALMAVAYSIELYPEVAEELHRLKQDQSLVGLGAKYTLENWEKGEMRVLKELLGP